MAGWPENFDPSRAQSEAIPRPSRWRTCRRGLATRWQLGQELCRGGRNGANRLLESDFSRRRGGLDTTDLAHELPGGRLDLLNGGFGFQPAERGDVPAHVVRLGASWPPVRRCGDSARRVGGHDAAWGHSGSGARPRPASLRKVAQCPGAQIPNGGAGLPGRLAS